MMYQNIIPHTFGMHISDGIFHWLKPEAILNLVPSGPLRWKGAKHGEVTRCEGAKHGEVTRGEGAKGRSMERSQGVKGRSMERSQGEKVKR